MTMPSRAYTSFLPCSSFTFPIHDYYSVNALSGLYLISTESLLLVCYTIKRVNALSGLYLISTVPLQKPRFYAVSRTCLCRYLSEYSDNIRFSCMLTFWTYLMRCTYPWHWIKYSTNYNRCHPIFHSLDKLSWAVTRCPLVLLLRLLCAKCILLFIKFILFCQGQALDDPRPETGKSHLNKYPGYRTAPRNRRNICWSVRRCR